MPPLTVGRGLDGKARTGIGWLRSKWDHFDTRGFFGPWHDVFVSGPFFVAGDRLGRSETAWGVGAMDRTGSSPRAPGAASGAAERVQGPA